MLEILLMIRCAKKFEAMTQLTHALLEKRICVYCILSILLCAPL